MTGLKLFGHSVRMVIGNLKEVVQIFLVPVLLVVVCIAGFALSLGLNPKILLSGAKIRIHNPEGGQLLLFFLLFLCVAFLALWTAVAWHRFILLDERPKGMIPPLKIKQMVLYLGLSLLIAVILILPVFLLVSVGGVISAVLIKTVGIWPVIGINFLLSTVLMTAFLSLSPALPTAAIGGKPSIGEAAAATSGGVKAIFVSVILLYLLSSGLEALAPIIAKVSIPLAVAEVYLSSLIEALLSLSLMTTIYGHYVEGRALS